MLESSLFQKFLSLPESRQIEYILENHGDRGLLLSFLRSARHEQDLISMHAVIGGVYEDLAMPLFDANYIAALAACPISVASLKQIVEQLKIDRRELSWSYAHVDPTWAAPIGVQTHQPFVVSVIGRITALGADPTQAGYWRPFAHPRDVHIKELAAGIVVRANDLTDFKIRQWLNGDFLFQPDAEIIGRSWEHYREQASMMAMANRAPITS